MMIKKTIILSLFLLLIISIIKQVNSQSSLSILDYSNVIPKDKARNLITVEGNPVEVTILYEEEILFVNIDQIIKAMGMNWSYDDKRSVYVINGQDFNKRKLYQSKSPKGEKIIFVSVIDLLKFLKVRYTISELGEYPSIRIQTSSFSLATPTPIIKSTPKDGSAKETPTVSPQDLFSQKCTKCHNIGIINQKPHGSAEWANIVGMMQSKDPAWISNEESSIIIQYLSGDRK